MIVTRAMKIVNDNGNIIEQALFLISEDGSAGLTTISEAIGQFVHNLTIYTKILLFTIDPENIGNILFHKLFQEQIGIIISSRRLVLHLLYLLAGLWEH